MAQLIYAILALMMVMFLSMNMQRNVGRDQQEQALNEVATQLTGVGTGVLEQIGTRHFDKYTLDNERELPYCGRIAEEEKQYRLSREGSVNFGACATDDRGLDCRFIEGFEGVREPVTRGGIDYNVEILDVQYVDPNDFDRVLPDDSTSFAKKVIIEVTNPFLYVGDDPSNPDAQFSLTLERVFTYGCATSYVDIPFERTTCPADRVPAETPCSRWAW